MTDPLLSRVAPTAGAGPKTPTADLRGGQGRRGSSPAGRRRSGRPPQRVSCLAHRLPYGIIRRRLHQEARGPQAIDQYGQRQRLATGSARWRSSATF